MAVSDTREAPGRREISGWDLGRAIAVIGAAFFLGGGLWAMIDPASFYDNLAEFPPYNQHFIQDVGAFQLGLGTVLLVAVVRPHLDALGVGLLGVGVGSVAHVVSHAVGHDLGGTPRFDIPSLSLLAGLLLVGAWDRFRRTTP